jgi:rhodanese-related sulfurtransferase
MRRHMPLVRMLLISITLLLPSLGYSADIPPSVDKIVAQAKQAVKTVDLAEFKAMYDKKDAGLLVDVRDPDEFAAGHIPGAVNVSRGTLEFNIWKLVGGPDKPDLNIKMTLYCASGGRCALAAKSLKDLGFTNVTAVSMKLADWRRAGYAFEER